MRFIKPTPITDARLTSSTVAEADQPEWASGTTYAAGARVMLAATHRIYQSLAGSNVGNNPATSPAHWVDVGPTNRWAMFDRSVGTQTVAGNSLTVVLSPGGIDAIALVETQASSAHITLTSSGTTVYDKTISFEAAGYLVDDWFKYFFAPVGRKKNLVLEDLPIYTNGVLTIEITHETAVKVGVLLVGQRYTLGETLSRPRVGITDYSRKETNAFGVTDVVERAFSKRFEAQLRVETGFVDDIQEQLASVRATPCLWIGGGGFDALTVYGFYKSFEIDLTYPDLSFCSMQLEGLI